MFDFIHSTLRKVSCGIAGALSLAFLTPVAPAQQSDPFSDIVCLGDSLSDVGRIFDVTGGAFPPAPYYDGRFCNGPLWNEYLAEKLDMDLDPDSQFAFGGALTSNLNYNSIPPSFILPGFEQQVDEVLAWNGRRKVDPRALYTVWIGANDFFAWLLSGNPNPTGMMVAGTQNTVQGIVDLSNAGAHYIVVFNLPDLGKTPTVLGFGPATSGVVSYLCSSYNAMLDDQLDALAAKNRRLKIIRIDAFALINDMVANPADYGFTNVTGQALLGAAPPDQCLFWDGVHPTTAAQEHVAETVYQGLRLEFPRVR